MSETLIVRVILLYIITNSFKTYNIDFGVDETFLYTLEIDNVSQNVMIDRQIRHEK